MVYSFELIKHSNIRYREAVVRLSSCELLTMLHALSVDCEVNVEELGGSSFLTFECRELAEAELRYLASHSSVSLIAAKPSPTLLKPLSSGYAPYLPEDLPEVLKYKGKTSTAFTRMMINTAAALTPYVFREEPIWFVDPLCGKATGCFCALTLGMNTVGVDQDMKSLKEASTYFARYLKVHRLKHESRSWSETAGKQSVPVTEFRLADTREHYLAGEKRSLSLACADSSLASVLFRHRSAHLLVADLPYGVQHAPWGSGKLEPLEAFLRRILPAWQSLLAPGGAMALSFNTLTLPTSSVRQAVTDAGLQLPDADPFHHLKHEVEQSVTRDVVFACKN